MRLVGLRGIRIARALIGVAAAVVTTFGAAYGQTETLVVGISTIDSQSFPKVTATVNVADSAGNSIPGLGAGDFRLLEDGVPVPPSAYILTSAEGEPVSLVLALDASVQWPSFRQVQSAAKALIDSLGPKDEVAILVFAETVEVAQPYTANKAALKSSIDSLVATGLVTALNDAALKAVNVASTAPTSNRAVVIVTNSGDASGNSSASAAVSQAAAAHLPIFTFGYGSTAATTALESIAEATGGAAYELPDAAALAQSLPTVEDGLRSVTYTISFQSGLPADNRTHTLAIEASHAGVSGQGNGSFIAVSHAVSVKVPGIDDGQSVVGKVYLVAEVESAYPVAAVEYLLNGQSIASVTSAPYSFEWDSTTVNPGTYQLTVRATDSAGNQGEKDINVVVSLPFSVQISASSNRLQVGDRLTIDARVDTPAQVAQVDLLVDDQVVATDTSAPFHFQLDTKVFAAGEHTVAVRAVDALGRSARSDLPVRLTEAVLPIVIRWVFVGLILIAILVTFIVGIGLARSAALAQEKRLFRSVRVELTNQGNARSRYELRADDPISALSFDFSLNGTPLEQRQTVESVAGSGSEGARPAVTKTVPARSSAGRAAPAKGGGALGGARALMGIASFFGEILTSVGAFLPAGLGNSLTTLGYRMRGSEYTVSRLESTAKQAKDASTGGGYGSGTSSTPTIGSQRGGALSQPGQATASAVAPTAVMPGMARIWAQTPVVDPGQTLAVTLTLRPLKSKQTQQYFFRVISQAVDADGVAPVIDQGNVQIKGLSALRRLLPLMLIAGMLVVVLFLIALLLVNVGLFG